jgi:hypothetical protein
MYHMEPQTFLVGNEIYAIINYLKLKYFYSFSFRLIKFKIYINMKCTVVRYHCII